MNETFADFLTKIDIDVTQEFRQVDGNIKTFGQTQMENFGVFGEYLNDTIPGSFAIAPKKLLELVTLSPDGKFNLDGSLLSFGNEALNLQFRLEAVGIDEHSPKAMYEVPPIILTRDITARILKMHGILDSEKVVITVDKGKASINIIGVIEGSKGAVVVPYPTDASFKIGFGKSFYNLINRVKNDDGLKVYLEDKKPLQVDLETSFYKIRYVLIPQKA